MKLFRTIRNYFCYCGIEKEEYKAVKKSAYVSNFEVWRVLHILMDIAFLGLFVYSLFNPLFESNKWFYLGVLGYSVIATILFFVMRKDSIAAQLLIYLSISILFLFAAFITQNKPNVPALAFVAFLLISPLFMIDKPYWMSLELIIASSIFCVWMYFVKPYEIWQMDLINTIIYTIIGIFIHIIVNSFRIKEFVYIRQINLQKDIDGTPP